MDINCLAVSTFQTESGEVLVNTEAKIGEEDATAPKVAKQTTLQTPRWLGNKLVRDVVLEAVQELTEGDINVEFAPQRCLQVHFKEVPRLQVKQCRT